MRLLLISSDEYVVSWLFEEMRVRGVNIVRLTSCAEGFDHATTQMWDAIVLHMTTEKSDILGLLLTLSRRKSCAPLLVISDLPDLEYRVAAFVAGADDVLLRPFHPHEFYLRLRALARRRGLAKPSRCVIGTFAIDFEKRRVEVRGERLGLGRIEYRALELLFEHQDAGLPTTLIRDRLYARGDRRLNTVQSVISRLSRKLQSAMGRTCIVNERGRGYRLAF